MFRLILRIFSSLMLLLAATAEMSDVPAQNFIQDSNGLSTPVDLPKLPDVDTWPRDVFMYKVMKYLQQQESSIDTYTVKPNESWPKMSVKEPDVKRWFSVFSTTTPAKPQRRWKIRKGFCYLKLCSFKPFSY